mmetsp:Transcript_11795/g.25130  ORF Transcript_11795/g.25130 Transcript_11795/m.25130 type:complete len:229 (+) Transcript_11795:2144-2830(+)
MRIRRVLNTAGSLCSTGMPNASTGSGSGSESFFAPTTTKPSLISSVTSFSPPFSLPSVGVCLSDCPICSCCDSSSFFCSCFCLNLLCSSNRATFPFRPLLLFLRLFSCPPFLPLSFSNLRRSASLGAPRRRTSAMTFWMRFGRAGACDNSSSGVSSLLSAPLESGWAFFLVNNSHDRSSFISFSSRLQLGMRAISVDWLSLSFWHFGSASFFFRATIQPSSSIDRLVM